MARLEPIHLKSSSAGIEVIRGTVYAEGYRVWNYDTDAWDEISVTSSGGGGGGGVDIGSGSADELYVESLTADKVWGFVDNDTIGINEEGKLYVKGIIPGMINYPFGLDSLTFNTTPSSIAFRFTEADAATGTGTFTSQSVTWNLDDSYAIVGAGVNALSATFYGTTYNYTSGASESAYVTAITTPNTSESFTDLVVTCSGADQDNILQSGTYDSLHFYARCQVGDTTHYDWGESNNPYEQSAQTKRFVLPSYALTSDSTSITKQDIIDAGNPTLAAYYKGGTYYMYSSTYTDDSQRVYIWFIVPDSHCSVNSRIQQNTMLGWFFIETTYVNELIIGSGDHTFTYKMFRSTNLQSPIDSFNEQYRLYW